jgi:hypothetical protein
MTTKPEELDAAEQRELALSMAPHFTLAEFSYETRKFNHIGGGELVEIWRQARNLDLRTGEELRPSLQPSQTVNTAAADHRRITEHVGRTIPQRGVNQ